MILKVLKYPEASLNKPCEKISEITPEIKQLASDMLETMYAAPGVGLAAPQVGHNIRLLVMDPQIDGKKMPKILVNPLLELTGEEIVSKQEGCLSVPLDYRADVPRYSIVKYSALDIDGNRVTETLEGFPAIIIQHEADHLDGVLFIDRLGRLRRSLYDGKVKKWLKQQQSE